MLIFSLFRLKTTDMGKSHKKGGSIKKVAKKAAEKRVKKAVSIIAGHGDYRPTSFQRTKGRGDYFGDLLGGLGNKLGNWAQGKFRTLTGFGDYRSKGPKSNSLHQLVARAASTDAQNANSGPSQNPFVMGAMSVKFSGKAPRIQHREYICPIRAPDTPSEFNTQVFDLQPGLSGIGAVMPWGGSVFKNFLEYILHGGIFEYVTCSSNFSSTSALGTVSMSFLYDAEEPTLDSLLAVNNNEYTTSAAPSASFYHPLECAPKENATNVKFIRTGNSPAGTDSRFDDFGRFQISTDGLTAPAGTIIGHLWFSYDIEVLKAVMPDLHVGTTAQFDAPESTTLQYIWQNAVADPANSLPATLKWVDTGVATQSRVEVQMPPDYNGNYIAIKVFNANDGTNWGGAASALAPNVVGSDITPLAIFPTGLTTKSSSWLCSNSLTGAAGNSMVAMFAFSTVAKTKTNNYFNWTSSVTANAAGQKGTLVIVPIDNDITDILGLFTQLKKKNPEAAKLAELLSQLDGNVSALARAPTEPASKADPPNPDWDGDSIPPSRSDSDEKKEDQDLETSVHIDRRSLEALLSASSLSSKSRK